MKAGVPSAEARSGLRIDDLASIPDPQHPYEVTPEAVFGEKHWPEDPLLQRQYALELESWLDGMTRFRLTALKAMQSGEVTTAASGSFRRLVKYWAEPLAKAIEGVRETYRPAKSKPRPDESSQAREPRRRRKPGPRPAWVRRTASLDPEEIAWTAIETIVNQTALGRPIKQPALAVAIGTAIEWRHHFTLWRRTNPGLLRAYVERLETAGASRAHRQIVLRHGFNSKFMDGADEMTRDWARRWSAKTRAEIGLALLRMSQIVTGGRISIEPSSGARRSHGKAWRADQLVVTLNDETMRWLHDALAHGELRATVMRPMLVQPRPWAGPDEGGYFLAVGATCELITGGHRSAAAVKRRLTGNPEGAASVYRALNFLGQTRWRINRDVLEVVRQAKDADLSLPGLPAAYKVMVSPKPVDIATNEEAARAWRQAKARAIEAEIKQRGRALRALRIIAEAERFADEPAIHFPHRCDFRGRIYPMPSTLNIQGTDLARALLQFADGQPIETDEAADWLAAHTAKVFGHGQCSLAERIAWTHANEPLLRRIAEDPLGNRQEWEATAPEDGLWLALAAAKEWVGFLDHGYGFVTHLPVFVDGSANGYQHFAAMARDRALGSLVNLTPQEQPSDIYRVIADQAADIVRTRAEAGDRWARRWRSLLAAAAAKKSGHIPKPTSKSFAPERDHGRAVPTAASPGGVIPRATAKQIVMAIPYGATSQRIKACIGELLDELDPLGWYFADDERSKAEAWLAQVMQEAVSEKAGSALAIMAWLKDVVSVVTRHGRNSGLHWTTPTGWPWVMAYGRRERTRAEVRDDQGQRSTAVVIEESRSKLDAREQRDAITANFVQALDAAALVLALDEMQRCDVSGAGAIHDCACGLATEMSAIGNAIREGFARVYADGGDPLGTFHAAALTQVPETHWHQVPPPPTPVGTLVDVRSEVAASPYFFA